MRQKGHKLNFQRSENNRFWTANPLKQKFPVKAEKFIFAREGEYLEQLIAKFNNKKIH